MCRISSRDPDRNHMWSEEEEKQETEELYYHTMEVRG